MTALASFTFRGFTLRPTRRCGMLCTGKKGKQRNCHGCTGKSPDEKLAALWTAADPWHNKTTPSEFWTQQAPGVESYVLEDRFGAVLFFKMVRQPNQEVELHVQFPPEPADARLHADQRERIVNGLILGFEWLERVLRQHAIQSVSFLSNNPTLTRFCAKRLGFGLDGEDRLRKVIAYHDGKRN